jgi:hypothetical protein
MPSMKKTSKKHLVLKRNTLKALTELPNTAYRHVVGGTGGTNGEHGCASRAKVGDGGPTEESF